MLIHFCPTFCICLSLGIFPCLFLSYLCLYRSRSFCLCHFSFYVLISFSIHSKHFLLSQSYFKFFLFFYLLILSLLFCLSVSTLFYQDFVNLFGCFFGGYLMIVFNASQAFELLIKHKQRHFGSRMDEQKTFFTLKNICKKTTTFWTTLKPHLSCFMLKNFLINLLNISNLNDLNTVLWINITKNRILQNY